MQTYLLALLTLVRPDRPDRHGPTRDERGDVPGWVLVTVMTAGLVMAIWGVADGQLTSMLTTALNRVR